MELLDPICEPSENKSLCVIGMVYVIKVGTSDHYWTLIGPDWLRAIAGKELDRCSWIRQWTSGKKEIQFAFFMEEVIFVLANSQKDYINTKII